MHVQKSVLQMFKCTSHCLSTQKCKIITISTETTSDWNSGNRPDGDPKSSQWKRKGSKKFSYAYGVGWGKRRREDRECKACIAGQGRVLGSPVTGSSHDIPKCFLPPPARVPAPYHGWPGHSLSFIRAFPSLWRRGSSPVDRRAHRMQPCVIRHDLCFLPLWHYAPRARASANWLYYCSKVHYLPQVFRDKLF